MLERTIDGAILRQGSHRLGRQDALGTMANLQCERDARIVLAGLGDGGGFSPTMTREGAATALNSGGTRWRRKTGETTTAALELNSLSRFSNTVREEMRLTT